MGKRERPSSETKAKKRSRKDKVKFEKGTEKSKLSSRDGARTSTNSGGKNSVFLKKKVEVEASLFPGSLHNCEEALQDAISQLLMKYSDGLGGILMAFENVRIQAGANGQGRGWILDELPWIHYTASCDALVFRPNVGCQLQGAVNECYPSHLGILVLNYFNAMVTADQLRGAGFMFDPDLQKWVSDSGAQTISVDSKITFTVDKIHECEGTVSLEGTNPSLSLLVER